MHWIVDLTLSNLVLLRFEYGVTNGGTGGTLLLHLHSPLGRSAADQHVLGSQTRFSCLQQSSKSASSCQGAALEIFLQWYSAAERFFAQKPRAMYIITREFTETPPFPLIFWTQFSISNSWKPPCSLFSSPSVVCLALYFFLRVSKSLKMQVHLYISL